MLFSCHNCIIYRGEEESGSEKEEDKEEEEEFLPEEKKKEKFCSCFKSFSYFTHWIFQKSDSWLVHLLYSSSIKYTRC